MVFSSLYFLYFFLPVCLLCYGLSPSLTVKNVTLTVFSLLFYAWGEPTYIILLLISVLMNYLFGLGIGACQKRGKEGGAKAVMILSLLFNIGLLGVFKYSNFIVENLNLIPGVNLPSPNLTLPIGISFYTFQILSYIIDLYWEKIEVQKNPPPSFQNVFRTTSANRFASARHTAASWSCRSAVAMAAASSSVFHRRMFMYVR